MAISYALARQAPMLDAAGERRLIDDWQTNRDRNALESLIISHARLVFAYVGKLTKRDEEREELVSEGVLGLIRAADLFDLGKNVRFSTYARWSVQNAIRNAHFRLRTVVDLPVGAADSALADTGGRRIDLYRDADVANAPDEVRCDDPTPEERLIAASDRDLMRECLDLAMSRLTETERDVVRSRNLQPSPDSVEDLAARLGTSRQRIRQIEKRALSRMKNELFALGISPAKAGF